VEWWQSLCAAAGKEAGSLADAAELVQGVQRLLAAAAAGAVIGWQRQRAGKSAGLRTHMLMALGAALLILAPLSAGVPLENISRVIQGVAEGLGFIGGGVILKLTQQERVRGLTTAAGLWMTAALGVSAGLGRYLLALIGTLAAWFVLSVVRYFEVAEGEKAP